MVKLADGMPAEYETTVIQAEFLLSQALQALLNVPKPLSKNYAVTVAAIWLQLEMTTPEVASFEQENHGPKRVGDGWLDTDTLLMFPSMATPQR